MLKSYEGFSLICLENKTCQELLPSSGSLRSPGTKPFPVQHWLFTPHIELPTNRQPKSMLCLVNNYYNNLQEFLPTSVDLSLLQMSSAVRGIPEAPGSCTRSCGCSCEKENKLPHVEKHLLLKCQTPHCTSSCSSQQMRFPLPTWAGALSQALFSGYSCTLQKGLSSEGAAIWWGSPDVPVLVFIMQCVTGDWCWYPTPHYWSSARFPNLRCP